MHVNEDLAEPPVILVFAGSEIDLVTPDHRLLRVALAAARQPAPVAAAYNAFDENAKSSSGCS